jgi:hypothetical protein
MTSEKTKKQMQNVSFDTVEQLLDYLPRMELIVVERLRELIFECIPNVEEKISYNVPFYRRHALICYIWPGSVSWGKSTKEGVQFGFNYGNLLNDESNYLDKGKRKQVYTKDFHAPSDIDEDILRTYLYEASIVDEGKVTMKRQKKR